jgi:hypothetical protein
MNGNVYTIIKQRQVQAFGEDTLNAYFVKGSNEVNIAFTFDRNQCGAVSPGSEQVVYLVCLP